MLRTFFPVALLLPCSTLYASLLILLPYLPVAVPLLFATYIPHPCSPPLLLRSFFPTTLYIHHPCSSTFLSLSFFPTLLFTPPPCSPTLLLLSFFLAVCRFPRLICRLLTKYLTGGSRGGEGREGGGVVTGGSMGGRDEMAILWQVQTGKHLILIDVA